MIERLTNRWSDLLRQQTAYAYYENLQLYLNEQYATETIYPKREQILNALQITDYEDVKVVLLGQDPYHGANQAHGLSFSVLAGQKLPPSLKNMIKELQEDIGCDIPDHGDLTYWAEQGVLLLNTVLTVRAGEANSHKGKGWEQFTDTIIELLVRREKPVVFLLWGKPAQRKRSIIERFNNRHVIIEAPHPSPLSAYRGFFGSKPYSKVNDALMSLGQTPINWCLTSFNRSDHQQAKLFE